LNWIITELFYPDEVSTAQILTDIALKKVEEKDVNVICGPPGYEKQYNFQKKALDSRIKIIRISLPELNKNKLIQRILRLVLLTFKMSWVILIKVKKKDHVFVTTNPTFLIITIGILKSLKGFNLEILVHDVFPENLVPAGLIKKDSFKYKLLSIIYNNSYRKADRIIVLGEDMKTLLNQKTSPKNIKIDIIPNWYDDDVYPVKDFNISKYLGVDVEDKIVLCFAGNLGRLQGVLEFIELVDKAENSSIALVIVGDGALKTTIKDKIKNDKLHNIYYLGPKSRGEQNLFLNACHVGIVTLKSGMKGLGVPSKTYNLMAAAKPLLYIGDHGSEVDNYIKAYDCGWSFSWENEDEILTLLKSLTLEGITSVFEKGLKSKIASNNFKKDNLLNLY
jgi:glycosyltransferase involved in cell wall biosynthesis